MADYHFDFTTGYNPPTIDDNYLSRETAYYEIRGADAPNYDPRFLPIFGHDIYDHEYDSWAAARTQRHNEELAAYNKAYDDWYNSPSEQMKRLKAAGFNPFYAQGAASAASSGVGSMQPLEHHKDDNTATLLSAGQSVLETIFGIVSAVQGIQQQKANIDLTNARADVAERSADSLVGAAGEKLNKLFLSNTRDVSDLFKLQQGYNIGYTPFGQYAPPDETSRYVRERNAQIGTKEYNLSQILPAVLAQKSAQNKLLDFSVTERELLMKFFQDRILPSILSGYDYEKAFNDFEREHIDGAYKRQVAREWIQSSVDILNSVGGIVMPGIKLNQNSRSLDEVERHNRAVERSRR